MQIYSWIFVLFTKYLLHVSALTAPFCIQHTTTYKTQERYNNRTWGSSQDYSTDPNSWNRKQERHKTGHGDLHRIIHQTLIVGIENRSSTKTGHGGSSQDYPTDPNSWNIKQERHKNRAWGVFTGLSNGLPTVGLEKEHTLPQHFEIIQEEALLHRQVPTCFRQGIIFLKTFKP
jgi:hypothetical protein